MLSWWLHNALFHRGLSWGNGVRDTLSIRLPHHRELLNHFGQRQLNWPVCQRYQTHPVPPSHACVGDGKEKALSEILQKGRLQPHFSSTPLDIRDSARKPVFVGSPALTFCFLLESFGSRTLRISAFIKTKTNKKKHPQALTLKVTERSKKM